MYRVRKSWSQPDTQIGAYENYENAVNAVDKNPGYNAYDDAGVQVYPKNTSNLVSTDEVKTMFYKAKLLKNVGKHKKGDTVKVYRERKGSGDWIWVLGDGTEIPKREGYLDLTKQIYDPDCKYSKAVAEAWVNEHNFKSETKWLFWANKWGQRVYIFKGENHKWVLQKTYKCGTGTIADGDGGDPGVGYAFKIYDKQKAFPGPRVTQYWNMHYSSPWGNSIHKGTVGKPSTHGCIALRETAAKWCFENLPLNTKVILF